MVLEGVTVIDPAVAPPVEKLVLVQEVAFVELHVSVEDWPAVMEVGLAEREAVGTPDAEVPYTANSQSE